MKKKIRLGTLILLVFIFGILIGANLDTEKQTTAIPQSNPPTKIKVAEDEINITKTILQDSNGTYRQLVGEAKNMDSVRHSVFLKAVFYDGKDKIIGTSETTISDLEPGQSKTFTFLVMDDITDQTHYKIEIEKLI